MAFSEIKAQKHGSYNVKLDNDNNCWITGMGITKDGRRLLTDFENMKIKLFSPDMTSLCSLSLSTRPGDIAITDDGEAVVSCFQENLILDISEKDVKIKGKLKLPFIAAAIEPYKDKLLVASWNTSPRGAKLVDRDGQVNWSTDKDQQGDELFSVPRFLTCHDDGGSATLIVSDSGNDTLTALNADTGDIIARRKVEGKGPKGVTTDINGNIYVCFFETNEVAVLTKDLSKEKVLLSESDGLGNHPQGIAYSAGDNQLLLSYNHDGPKNSVDCFTLQ